MPFYSASNRQSASKPDPQLIQKSSILQTGMPAATAHTRVTTGTPLPPRDDQIPFHLSILPNVEKRLREMDPSIRADRKGQLVRQLIADGNIDEYWYFQQAAKRLNIPYLSQLAPENLMSYPDSFLLDTMKDKNWILLRPFARQKGVPIRPESRLVSAPFGDDLNRLERKLESEPSLRRRICLTSPKILQAAQRTAASKRALETKVYQLKQTKPHLSAHQQLRKQGSVSVLMSLSALLLLALLIPLLPLMVNILAIFIFLSIAGLRFAAFAVEKRLETKQQIEFNQVLCAIKSHTEWPSYSILVPLYREAAVVADLVAALSKIDYPKDKLNIHLLIEADDHETWQALATLRLPAFFSVVSIPVQGPRTKPKALNYALAFVQSEMVVIYDAEDRPHPLQLKEAAIRMAKGGPDLACLQGRLAIDNEASTFLTRQFAIEYASLFDGLLPYLTARSLPIPLGGTSNHFRTSILKQLCGWDPFNVTEDADLGIRLTRLGYRTEILKTETWEEAPEYYSAWLKQRTRWFKGWMQTLLVHSRNPQQLLSDLGMVRFYIFQVILGGLLISTLIHPLYILTFASTFLIFFTSGETLPGFFWLMLSMNSLNLILGYIAPMLLGYSKSRKRYGYGFFPILAMPLYWLMMTPAAWRALFQLFDKPFLWEKTTHGVSRERDAKWSKKQIKEVTMWSKEGRK